LACEYDVKKTLAMDQFLAGLRYVVKVSADIIFKNVSPIRKDHSIDPFPWSLGFLFLFISLFSLSISFLTLLFMTYCTNEIVTITSVPDNIDPFRIILKNSYNKFQIAMEQGDFEAKTVHDSPFHNFCCSVDGLYSLKADIGGMEMSCTNHIWNGSETLIPECFITYDTPDFQSLVVYAATMYYQSCSSVNSSVTSALVYTSYIMMSFCAMYVIMRVYVKFGVRGLFKSNSYQVFDKIELGDQKEPLLINEE
jgi:hypothetical protein